MGTRYEQHSDMCGCERCALQYETDHPQPVFDSVEDPDYLGCGCHANRCDCAYYDGCDDEPDFDR